jgi:acetyl esterase/lipase
MKRIPSAPLVVFFLFILSACQPAGGNSENPTVNINQNEAQTTPAVLADTAFAAYAFVDTNEDGHLDENDSPLEGASFIAESFGSQTDANGFAMILIPGNWDDPITAKMIPPEGSNLTPIGPGEVTLQNGVRNQARFLFAPPAGSSPTSTPIQVDLPYCTTVDGVELTMDLYQPRKAIGDAPAVVYIHGGGWTSGDKSDGVGLIFKQELTRRGYIYAAINYRLAPKYTFPAQIEDVKCAIRHLRAEADRYGLDPLRIGVIGGSAGGHLAALLGTSDAQAGWDVGEYTEQSSRVQAVIDLYGPTDLKAMLAAASLRYATQVFGASDNQDEVLDTYSPVTYVSPDDPPFLIMHGDQDQVVPLEQSQILYERLKSDGVPVELVIVKNAGHSFEPAEGQIEPNFPELFMLVGDFFDQYLQ